MTTAEIDVPRFAVAGAMLEALAARDFAAMAALCADDAALNALVPRGLREHSGPAQIELAFENWFGDTEEFELVDADIGEVGPRLQLRWRVRLRAQRLGEAWHLVEQNVYADTDHDGRITRLALLCSGYCPEK